MREYFYNGMWRMDWGLGNPNKTAALIAMLMVATWGFTFIRRGGAWIVLLLFTVLGVCLIHTYSRGGLLALFVGLVPVLLSAPRPWKWKWMIPAAASIWIMVGTVIVLDANDRYSQGVVNEDRSITNRIEIWKRAPQMMVSAPGGWGLGNSGNAYVSWFQPLDHSEKYRTLVNSHLTWLVELSWPGRVAYVALWLSIFVLVWPSDNSKLRPLALGVWLAFAVSAAFSSVAESPWLWIVPIATLLAVIVERIQHRQRIIWQAWTIPAMGGLLVGITCFILGTTNNGIRKTKSAVILGKGRPECWIVADSKIVGQNYGRQLRAFADANRALPAVGFVDSVASLVNIEGRAIVLMGTKADENSLERIHSAASRIIVLNPIFFPPKNILLSEEKMEVFFGEFSQSPSAATWKAQFAKTKTISGVGDFLSDWPKIVFDCTSL